MHLITDLKQRGSEVVPVQGMAALCHMQWWIFTREKALRQMNMDYALCEALKHNTDGIWHALTFYDVNCQYHKYLKNRIAESSFLDIPEQLEIILGIGLWHVHGHQDSCYVRYASSFIKGATCIDGEIMEFSSACGIGMLHHKECLDYQMNDCNFMKMIRMSKAICHKFRQVVKGVAESTATFEKLNDSTDAIKVQHWEEQERLAQEHTNKKTKLTAVVSTRGAATWLAEGISIEEAQVTLQIDVRKLGRYPTKHQQLEIAHRHERLQGKIDCWEAIGLRFLGNGIGDGDVQTLEQEFLILEDDEDEYIMDEFGLFEPEKIFISMSSNLGVEKCTDIGTADLIQQELTLGRDRRMMPFTTSECILQTRQSFSAPLSEQQNHRPSLLELGCKFIQWTGFKLSADNTLLERYCPLAKEHLKVSTAVADPNARGQRINTLARFWSMDVERDSNSSDWLNEFYHVHWLHAKAMMDHWKEELLLVQYEMNWTCKFFLHKAEQWIHLSIAAQDKQSLGHIAYVAWQRKMYQAPI
ncbi:uncharacterized protein F5891DRAFT_980514 [Suillus fuscotomentosus]|uniref:CxC2-like cysteine cluster KDZ transposase-associated domain-containing protein n=1 Tax=Suillus fuscotomentosus TaxID=1912939 RepID=A0AAD4E879_9AGAM|nr:uncharacterized protein F5891DRAFT_980514 [Suillus fuscotomentosus]KAG1900244.1 hypothetical protein F5891DRAFT_980514 [Suillus fuscotomentosus]